MHTQKKVLLGVILATTVVLIVYNRHILPDKDFKLERRGEDNQQNLCHLRESQPERTSVSHQQTLDDDDAQSTEESHQIRAPGPLKEESIADVSLSETSYRSPGPRKKGFMELHKLLDDYSYCPRQEPFLGPFQYNNASKNPCWWEGERFLCVPYFYIVGFSKCGTTDLYFRVRMHPEVFVGDTKEKHWFDYKRFFFSNGLLQNYSQLFTEETSKVKQEIQEKGYSGSIMMDATPCYIWDSLSWPCLEGNEGLEEPLYTNADVIQRMTPDAKIIVSVREPVKRLYSRMVSWVPLPHHEAYVHPTSEAFEELIVNAVNKYNECFKKWSVRQCAYNGTLYGEVRVRLQEGMYSVFIQDWLKVFPKEQIFISRFEDYVKDNKNVLERVFQFLDISPISASGMDKIVKLGVKNKSRKVEKYLFTNRSIEVLEEFYRPFVKELAQMMGDSKFAWHYS